MSIEKLAVLYCMVNDNDVSLAFILFEKKEQILKKNLSFVFLKKGMKLDSILSVWEKKRNHVVQTLSDNYLFSTKYSDSSFRSFHKNNPNSTDFE